MTPDLPPNPRAELEAKVTALLLGELSQEEAAQFREQIARDLELKRLHERLSQTLDYVREMAAAPQSETTAQPAPLRMSPERREKLLASFKTIKPEEFKEPGRWLISPWIAAAACLCIVGLLSSMLLPALAKAKNKSQRAMTTFGISQVNGLDKSLGLERERSTDERKPVGQQAVDRLSAPVALQPAPTVAVVLPQTDGIAKDAEIIQKNDSYKIDSDNHRLYFRSDLRKETDRGESSQEVVVAPQVSNGNPFVGRFAFPSLGGGAFQNGLAATTQKASTPAPQAASDEAKLGVAKNEVQPFAFPSSGPSSSYAAPATTSAEVTFAIGDAPLDSRRSPTPAHGGMSMTGSRTLTESTFANGTVALTPVSGVAAAAAPSAASAPSVLAGGAFAAEPAPIALPSVSLASAPLPAPTESVVVNSGAIAQNNVSGFVVGDQSRDENRLVEGINAGVDSTIAANDQKKAKLSSAGGGGVREDASNAILPATGATFKWQFYAGKPAELPANAPVTEKSRLLEGELVKQQAAVTAMPEVRTRDNAFSTFSLNVSDASFKLAEASLQNGQMPNPADVRTEEFINAFDYRDPEPPAGAPIGFAWERAADPFAHNRDFVRFSIKAAAQGREAERPLNLVLLLDKSGSMERADRVAIIAKALDSLATQLHPNDLVSVVIFARTPSLRVDGIPASELPRIAKELRDMTPEGGTNLEEAMKLAYQTALRHYLNNGENRVVLLTDGAANLGDTGPANLKAMAERYRKQGVNLDCFGIGWDGYNDTLLETVSRGGGGRYGFINTPEEASSELAGKLAGAFRVAAADVKVQVEFNPNRVVAYRQIGYLKDQLRKEDFRNNDVKAAQISPEESGNALYAVQLNPAGDGPIGTVHVRYRVPGTSNYEEHAWPLDYSGSSVSLDKASAAMRLATTSASFAEWLAGSPYAGEVTPDKLLQELRGIPQVYGADGRPAKLEWMIRQAKSISGK